MSPFTEITMMSSQDGVASSSAGITNEKWQNNNDEPYTNGNNGLQVHIFNFTQIDFRLFNASEMIAVIDLPCVLIGSCIAICHGFSCTLFRVRR